MNDGIVAMLAETSDDEPLAIQSGADGKSLQTSIEREFNLVGIICKCCHKVPLFTKVLTDPKAYLQFWIQCLLIWTKN